MTKDGTNNPQNQPLETHQFELTLFSDNQAQSMALVHDMTLPGLAELIGITRAAAKDDLPLLKMAVFGEERTAKNCLRSNANLRHITGIEVEHDNGKISRKAALKILQVAKLRCVVYTTPSHIPVQKERWRVLLPLSKPHDKTERSRLVARVNGLFDGHLARESFALSQAFYYGSVEGRQPSHITLLDGDFIDLRTDLDPTAKGPTAQIISIKTGQPSTSHSMEDLKAFKDSYRRTGDGWHNTILVITASLVSRQWSDDDIADFCAEICDHGRDDPEMLEMLRSARDKFGRKAPPAALKALLAVDSGDNPPEVLPPAKPAHDAPFAAKVDWLLATRGQYEDEGRVIKLFEPSDACRVKPADFRDAFAAWRDVRVGPRGGQQFIEAVAAWSTSPHRVMLDGVRMAPDRPFPLFEEQGKRFKNTYQRPQHAGQGDVAPFLTFLARLIPDAREREYKLNWMAHKLAHPEVPGVAIMHVADNDLETDGAREGSYGTGRGLLFSIARRLFGAEYCGEQDFRILTGMGGQADFTDWLHNRILVTCDEAQSSPTYYRRGERALAYETLKRVLDPAVTDRTFTGKYKQAFAGRCHCSVWIATNHSDAIAIPSNDRRITVLRNGRAPTRDEIADIVAWRDAGGSLAALAAFLRARDLASFSMYEPLATSAKAAMAEAGASAVEETMLEIAADDSRGMVFFRDDLFNAVRAQHNQNETIGGHFEDAWRRHVTKATRPDGVQRRSRIGNTQRKLFCFRRMAKTVQSMSEEEVRDEIVRWRPITGLTVIEGSRNK